MLVQADDQLEGGENALLKLVGTDVGVVKKVFVKLAGIDTAAVVKPAGIELGDDVKNVFVKPVGIDVGAVKNVLLKLVLVKKEKVDDGVNVLVKDDVAVAKVVENVLVPAAKLFVAVAVAVAAKLVVALTEAPLS